MEWFVHIVIATMHRIFVQNAQPIDRSSSVCKCTHEIERKMQFKRDGKNKNNIKKRLNGKMKMNGTKYSSVEDSYSRINATTVWYNSQLKKNPNLVNIRKTNPHLGTLYFTIVNSSQHNDAPVVTVISDIFINCYATPPPPPLTSRINMCALLHTQTKATRDTSRIKKKKN